MDEIDAADEQIERSLAANIAYARRVIPLHKRPALGCEPCSGIAQSVAKVSCRDYVNCLGDWEKEQRMNKVNGNV